MKQLLLLLVGGTILLSSCSQKFSVQKRKYTKGFYFASASPKNQTKNKEIVLVKEKIVRDEVIAEPVLFAQATITDTNTNYDTKISEPKSSKKIINQSLGFTRSFNFIPELQLTRKAKLAEINTNNKLQNKKSGVLDVLFGASMLVNLIYTVLILIALFLYLSTVLTTEQLLILGAIVLLIIVIAGALGR